jgi:hypothetical protein
MKVQRQNEQEKDIMFVIIKHDQTEVKEHDQN